MNIILSRLEQSTVKPSKLSSVRSWLCWFFAR